MSSLIEDGVLLDISKQAPSPSKDYINMRVTLKDIQWRHWRISPQCLKPDVIVTPTENISSLKDFLEDLDFQSEVKQIFGANSLEYVKNLCRGNYNFLDRLEKHLQIYILSFLELEEITMMSEVNSHFKELCDSDQLWEHVAERLCDTITPDLRIYAEEVGWKKAFFTDKVQLRVQMRRHQEQSKTTC